jgi:cytidylate kinase
MKKIVIAFDGHSSCGKSTMAKDLAAKIGYKYIDSGAMYRAVTLYSIENGIFKGNVPDLEALEKAMDSIMIDFHPNPETGRPDTYLNGKNVEKEIRSMDIAGKVSLVSTIGFVRRAMVCRQQEFGAEKGIVMDGRDIGTVVFPQAELKIFVTARPEIRAQRRLAELKAKGEPATFEEVLANIEQRDFIDSNRAESPLLRAEDAVLLDNSDLTIEEQNKMLLNYFKKKVIE